MRKIYVIIALFIFSSLMANDNITSWLLLNHSALIETRQNLNIEDYLRNNNIFNATGPVSTYSAPVEKKKAKVSKQNAGVHKVVKGETLYSISKKYHTSVNKLIVLNNLTHSVVSVGQVLKITESSKDNTTQSIVHTVQSGETFYSISRKYKVSVPKIKSANNIQHTDNSLSLGMKLKIPSHSSEVMKSNNQGIRINAAPSSAGFAWPVIGKVKNVFGKELGAGIYMEGIDINVRWGEAIRASSAGVVLYAGTLGNSSNKIIIVQHNLYISTVYSNLGGIKVKVGDKVTKGKVIGLAMNSNQSSTRPYIHFEIRDNYRPINPIEFLSSYRI